MQVEFMTQPFESIPPDVVVDGSEDDTPASPAPSADQLAWWAELDRHAYVGANLFRDWLDASGYSQERAAELIRAFLPRKIKRGMGGGGTLSRYQHPDNFQHATFAVLLTMLKVYGHDFADFATRVGEVVSQLRHEERHEGGEALSAARARRKQEMDLLDAFRLMTDAQRADQLTVMQLLGQRNQAYRAASFEQGGRFDVPDGELEVRAALQNTQNQTMRWAERQRQRRHGGGNRSDRDAR